MEITQVVQTGGTRASDIAAAPAQRTSSAFGAIGSATSSTLLSGLRNELEAVETPERNYECTIAFCSLLRTLLSHGPAVVPIHTLGATTRPHGLPAGIGPHIRFVLDAVLLPARTRPVAHDADRLRVAAAALGVLYDCVRTYAIISPPPALPRRGAASGPSGTSTVPGDAWVAGDPRWDFLDPSLLPSAGNSGVSSLPVRSHSFYVMRALLSSSYAGDTDDLLSVVLSVLGPAPGDAGFGLATGHARDGTAGITIGVLGLPAFLSGGGDARAWHGSGASSGGVACLETEAAACTDGASSAGIAKRFAVVAHAKERIAALQRAAVAAAGGTGASVGSVAASGPVVGPMAWMAQTSHEEAAALAFAASAGPDNATPLTVRALLLCSVQSPFTCTFPPLSPRIIAAHPRAGP